MAGLKSTRQRSAILSCLASAKEPMSAEDVFLQLKTDFPTLALSTVYRNLEQFAEHGMLRRENLADGILRYSALSEHGHYLICTQCNKKIRLSDCPLASLEKDLAKETGFEIDSHSLTIYGKCPHCRKTIK